MQKFLRKNLGQQVLRSRTTAGGGRANLGTCALPAAARPTPDGYTILVASSSFMIQSPGFTQKSRTTPTNDFDPVTEIRPPRPTCWSSHPLGPR